ncbi:DNA adenine methylase [Helicobacter himalayensis]|uniref:DNA adenine methylase n=1 Tax=Helicobacter himalayensis TaxID=1591088 RepID=UPI003D6ECA75
MRFIGNKESLAPKIYKLLTKHKIIANANNQSFFDMFAGSTSVGRFFKKRGFQIYSCDMLYFSYCLQKAYIENNSIPTFQTLRNYIKFKDNANTCLFEKTSFCKVLEFLNNLEPMQGFIYQNYAPSGSKDLHIPRMYFSDKNAQKIDAIRTQIQLWREKQYINESEYFILLASLIESVSLYANVAGVYAAFCKKWDKRALKDLQLKHIELVQSDKVHFCFYGESRECLEDLQDSQSKIFDMLYLDPPYNSRQYAPNYHLLETIAKYDNPAIKGIAGLREWSEQKSKFCNAKTALAELEKIARYAKYKYLILSYNSEGIIQKESIDELLKPLGTLICEQIPYPRFKSNNKRAEKFVSEYVWILKR